MLNILCVSEFVFKMIKKITYLYVFVIPFVALICGLITSNIFKKKGYTGGAALGVFLGIAGIIIAASLPNKKDILKELNDEISKLKDEISKLKDEISKLKNNRSSVVCKYCDGEMVEGENYCPYCGNKTDAE